MARSFQKIVFLSLVMLTSCAVGSVMTRSDYENITVGTPISEVEQKYGQPITIKKYKDGTQGYQYVERIMMGEETVQQNWYTIIVKNGQVISKKYNYKTPPAYDEIYEQDPNAIPELN